MMYQPQGLFLDEGKYDAQNAICKIDFCGQVEEFEIQFINSEDIDAELFSQPQL